MIGAMSTQTKLLIFTDLDGTLLDYHTYSKEAALPALKKIEELGIPLVIVSSKTRAEIEPLLDLPCMAQIFITENGSAVFFDQALALDLGEASTVSGRFDALILGTTYEQVLEGLRQAVQECGLRIRGFSDMSTPELARFTGLDLEAAGRAAMREFSEPFLFEGTAQELECLARALDRRDLTCVRGGRFHHALGRTDKGLAAGRVVDIYRRSHPRTSWKTLALGDSENDIPLLRTADVAVIIRRHDGTSMDYAPPPLQEVIRPLAAGPAGWNEAVVRILEDVS